MAGLLERIGAAVSRSFSTGVDWFFGDDFGQGDLQKIGNFLGLGQGDWVGSSAGFAVNEKTALTISAVSQGVRAISQTAAMMPKGVYQITSDGNKRDSKHPTDQLLRAGLDGDMTRMKFEETIFSHAVFSGNGYAAIHRDGDNEGDEYQADNLTLLNPYSVTTGQDKEGNPIYVVIGQDRKPEPYYPDEIFHVPGPGFDGRRGYSPIDLHKRSLGLSIAAEKYGAKFYTNGASLTGVLSHPSKLKPDARKNLKDSFRELHQGLNNAHGMFLAEEGMTFQPVTVAPEQAQWLGSRRFSTEEIARILDIPLSKLRDSSATTYQTLEQENLFFYQLTLLPWLIRFEEEVWRKLITPRDRRGRIIAHNPSILLKGDILTRYRAYALGINWSIRTPNECRREELLEDLPGGDIPLRPLNVQPFGSQPGSAPAGQDGAVANVPNSLDAIDPTTSANVDAVASTALNGAQVTSLKDIVGDVLLGIIPKSSGVALVQAAFPFLSPDQVDAIFADVIEGSAANSGADTNPDGSSPDSSSLNRAFWRLFGKGK